MNLILQYIAPLKNQRSKKRKLKENEKQKVAEEECLTHQDIHQDIPEEFHYTEIIVFINSSERFLGM